MPVLDQQIAAILWAQWRTLFAKARRGGAGVLVFTILASMVWYSAFVAVAVFAAIYLPEISSRQSLVRYLGVGLLLAFLYWQLIPIFLVSSGVSLDLRRLLVYPVAPRKLFAIEVLLRISTGIEVLVVMVGAAIGLWRSPLVPWWGPLVFLFFAAFNLFLSAGVRDLLTRLLARKGIREVLIFGLVLLSAIPQMLVMMFPPDSWVRHRGRFESLLRLPDFFFPWTLTAHTATASARWWEFPALLLWLALGAWFGYRQFLRGLRFDVDEVRARERDTSVTAPWWEKLFRLPSVFLPDPLGNLVEKEIRFLSRTPRFRLVFFMGFSFGLIIWMPIIFGRGARSATLSDNFLTIVSLYAVLLLGEVLFWNSFGFDRQAAQIYFVMPVRFSTVLFGKNLAALFWLFLEVTLVILVTELATRRYPLSKIVEGYAITLLLAVFLLAAGNMASVRYPRPTDPSQSWRHTSASRVQLFMMLLYPVIGIPIGLAYLARYAFEREAAFYAVWSVGLLVGLAFYWVSLDSAVETAESRRETILATLARSEGPVS